MHGIVLYFLALQVATLVGEAKISAAETQAETLRSFGASQAESTTTAAQKIADATKESALAKAAVEREKLAQAAQQANFDQAMALAQGFTEPNLTYRQKMINAAELAAEMQAAHRKVLQTAAVECVAHVAHPGTTIGEVADGQAP